MDEQPGGSTDDVAVFGPGESAVGRYVRRIRWPGPRMWAICLGVALAGSLAALAIVLSFGGTRTNVPETRSAAIQTLNEYSVFFVLRSGAKAALDAEYLRSGDGPPATWLTLVVTGLPRGYLYHMTVGECAHGRPVSLGGSSGSSEFQTDILMLSVGDLPVSPASGGMWVRIQDARGLDLGDIQGPFLGPAEGRVIASGMPACRSR